MGEKGAQGAGKAEPTLWAPTHYPCKQVLMVMVMELSSVGDSEP